MVKRLGSFAVLFFVFFASGLAADSRQDLGINGCSVRDAATYQSGTDLLTVVACEGPLGVFTSTDFGSTWSFAEGGSYSSGEAFGVAATPFGVYALRSIDSLIRTTLGTPGSFTPSWEALSLALTGGEQFVTVVGLESVGPLVIFGTSTAGTPAIRVLNTETDQLIALAPLPEQGILMHFAIIGSHIFAVRKDIGDIDGPNSLYRATFDTTTGAIGSWSDIASNVTSLLSGEFASAFVDGVYGGSNDTVFVRISRVDALKKVYRSTDSGDTFNFSFPSLGSDGHIQGDKYYAPGNFTRPCTMGATTIINSLISRDDGVTWVRLKPFISEGFNLFDEDLCIFDPRDTSGNTALVKVVEGFAKTTTLQATTPVFNAANTGLRGIVVKGMSRVTETETDTVAAVTNVGLAMTKNFSSNDRRWLFPTCTGRKTCWNDSIALARGNPNIVFAGTEDIERGYITADLEGNLSLDWDILLDNPSGATDVDDIPVTLQFRDFTEIPNRVFGLFQWVNPSTNDASGGIYSFTYSTDPEVPEVTEKPVILGGNPVADLIALNATTLYAAVNYTGSNVTNAFQRSIYRLTVAGDGSVTSQIDTSGDIGTSPGVTVFGYDVTNDILYAAGQGNSFYILEQASPGTTNWVRGSNIGPVSALTVAPNGDVFVSRLNEIYRSADRGQSWERVFTGLVDEQLKTIALSPSDIPDSGISSTAFGAVSAAAEPSLLVVGSSTGLNEVSAVAEPTPTSVPSPTPTIVPTPTVIASKCALKIEKKCRAKLKKKTSCQFTVTLRRKTTGAPLGGRMFVLEREKSSGWTALRSMTTKSSGNATVKVTVKGGHVLRARINTATVACTTKRLTVE